MEIQPQRVKPGSSRPRLRGQGQLKATPGERSCSSGVIARLASNTPNRTDHSQNQLGGCGGETARG